MSVFYNILDEHRDLLKSKEYDEVSLHSPDKVGWFMRQLKIYFSVGSNDAHKFNEKNEFDLKAIGFFNHDMDMVVFKFNYEYNPETMDLNIKSLEAELDGERLRFILKENKDLPSSKEIYKNLSQDKRLIAARKIAGHEVKGKGKRI